MDKEAYFTADSIRERSRFLLEAVAPARARRSERKLDPAAAALLILDMQAYFLEPDSHAFVPSAPAIVPCLQTLAELFRSASRPVIASRHVNTLEDAGMMASWWRELISPQSAHSQLITPFDAPNSTVIIKTQYDAFHLTPLERTLLESGTRQVVICGVMTHLCCESTARGAFMRGFEVFFPVDGTATYNLSFHRASLSALAHGFGTPVLSEQIEAWMRAYAEG